MDILFYILIGIYLKMQINFHIDIPEFEVLFVYNNEGYNFTIGNGTFLFYTLKIVGKNFFILVKFSPKK